MLSSSGSGPSSEEDVPLKTFPHSWTLISGSGTLVGECSRFESSCVIVIEDILCSKASGAAEIEEFRGYNYERALWDLQKCYLEAYRIY